MSSETYVTKYPDCDICKYEQGRSTEAHYDARTTSGQWGMLCDVHMATRGTGLGTGKGQKLIVGEKPVLTDEERRAKADKAVREGDLDTLEELMGDGDPADFF